MKRISLWCLVATMIVGMGFANDGVNRYRKVVPSTFQLFPQPVSPQAGYNMLDRDSETGADGEIQFHWAQRHAIALVRVAAYETTQDLGVADNPLLIFDFSSENGDTPIHWGTKPRGRHPGNSHDGGINLDLGYYLTSLKGKVASPDYAVCTEHYEKQADGTLKDVNMCLDRADKLDTPRMSRFLLSLFRIHQDHFGNGLIEEVGIDYQARVLVLEQIQNWAASGKFNASTTLLKEMTRVFTCDAFEGWQKYHHHHIHLRLRDLDYAGSYRPSLEAILERDRQIEYDLLQSSSKPGPFLHLSLLSTDLDRAIEAELLPTGEKVKDLKFRINNGAWQEPQAGDPRNRTVFDIPESFATQPGSSVVEADFTDSQGQHRTLQTVQFLPPLEYKMKIAVEPDRLKCEVLAGKDQIRLKPDFPAFYMTLITKASLVVYRTGEEPSVLPVSRPGEEISVSTATGAPVQMIEFRVTCAGRRTHQIPVYFAEQK